MSADPIRLTPLEQYANDLLRFDKTDRYVAQSRATEVNAPAPLPPVRPAFPFTDRSTTR